jgi:hypothetical protein
MTKRIIAPRVTIRLPVAVAPAKRPAILPVLYAGFAGLQAVDIHSTRAGMARGATELNPIVAPMAGDTGAILTMAAANSVVAIVSANNARVLHQSR